LVKTPEETNRALATEGITIERDMKPFYVDESKPWFKTESGWPERVPKNVDFPKITLYEMLCESVEAHPELPAVWFLNTFVSYRELLGHVDAMAAGLHQLGLRKGDVAAIALPSSFQNVISYYACAKLGLVVAGINPTYKPGEVLHELNLTGTKALIVLDALYEPLIAPILAQHPLEHIIVTNVVDLVKVSSLKKWLGKKLKKIPTGPFPESAVHFLDLLKKSAADRTHDVSAEDIASYVMTGALLLEGYGLSEASPVVSGGPLGPVKTTGTVGLPLPGIEWKIVDMETGTQGLLPGESGELVVAGPTVMQGYLNDPQETAQTVREIEGKRWLFTGDIGFMDEHGRVCLNDRKKQLIKVKGYSVFPTEVEQLMGAHEAISEVAVAGLPDRETGEAIKAWVVLKREWKGKTTEEELKAWCRGQMARYKVPKHLEFREEIPKTLVGKVMRRELQEADPIYKACYGK